MESGQSERVTWARRELARQDAAFDQSLEGLRALGADLVRVTREALEAIDEATRSSSVPLSPTRHAVRG